MSIDDRCIPRNLCPAEVLGSAQTRRLTHRARSPALRPEQRQRFIDELEERMREAARKFEFEKAAQLRDRVRALKMGEG